MSKSTRSLIIAAAAASLFLAGCATQGATDNTTAQPQPAASADMSKASCKGMSSCKGNTSCKGVVKKKKRHHKRKKAAPAETTSTTTTSSTTSTDSTTADQTSK